MKKTFLIALGATAILASPAFAQSSGTASPTVSHENPSSCLGAERASRNSNGGDRSQGAFGEAQAAYVAMLNAGGTMSYGEFLQVWKASCTYAAGK